LSHVHTQPCHRTPAPRPPSSNQQLLSQNSNSREEENERLFHFECLVRRGAGSQSSPFASSSSPRLPCMARPCPTITRSLVPLTALPPLACRVTLVIKSPTYVSLACAHTPPRSRRSRRSSSQRRNLSPCVVRLLCRHDGVGNSHSDTGDSLRVSTYSEVRDIQGVLSMTEKELSLVEAP
jgi:hypothetical protein